MEEKLVETLLSIMSDWGIYALFLMTFFEAALLLGIFIPGESMVIAAGVAASRGALDLTDVVAVASIGAVLGDTAGYFLGSRYGEGIFERYAERLRITKGRVALSRRFMERHGGKAVFIGRFTSVLRAFAPLVAGAMKMDYPKFLFYNVTGGVLWAASFAALGYFAGEGLDVYRGYLSGVFQALAVALALAGSYMLYRFLKKREAAVLLKRVETNPSRRGG
ncbi:MAG: DedA family protein [Deltaproteobacteria bacterium]|nr:DedA family protein [Deltaproteobacteria bacterium]